MVKMLKIVMKIEKCMQPKKNRS